MKTKPTIIVQIKPSSEFGIPKRIEIEAKSFHTKAIIETEEKYRDDGILEDIQSTYYGEVLRLPVDGIDDIPPGRKYQIELRGTYPEMIYYDCVFVKKEGKDLIFETKSRDGSVIGKLIWREALKPSGRDRVVKG